MSWRPSVPEPRKRLTQEERKARTRSALLDAAHALFAAQGLEATTVDDIAKTAGYTRGAFYAHFANKEAIMEALISEGFHGDLDALTPIEVSQSVREMGSEYQRYSKRFLEHPESLMWSLEFQMAALRHPELRDAYNRQYRELTDRVKRMIDRILEETGHPDPLRFAPLAEAFVALQTGLCIQRLMDPDRVPDTVFSLSFETLVRGMIADAR